MKVSVTSLGFPTAKVLTKLTFITNKYFIKKLLLTFKLNDKFKLHTIK